MAPAQNVQFQALLLTPTSGSGRIHSSAHAASIGPGLSGLNYPVLGVSPFLHPKPDDASIKLGHHRVLTPEEIQSLLPTTVAGKGFLTWWA